MIGKASINTAQQLCVTLIYLTTIWTQEEFFMTQTKSVDYPYSNDVYTSPHDIPDDGVAYNVAHMYNKYDSKAGNSVNLVKGASNSLGLTTAIEVTDSVAVSDTHSVSIKLSGGEKIPGEANYGYVHSTTYTHGVVKKFSLTNSITLTPKVDNLTATAYYYHIQMGGDRYMKVGGKPQRMNRDPNSFSADVTYAEGWVITHPDGSKAIAGVDY